MRWLRRTTLAAPITAVALLATACGGGTTDDGSAGTATTAPVEQSPEESPEETAAALPAGQFGPACGQIPSEGEGSSEGMADDPVATAASNNPVLSTLVSAVMQAELVDTLNSVEAATVFAPANSAFEKVPEEQLNALLADKDLLTTVLTYHVAGGEQLDAQALADAGEVDTLPEDLGPLGISVDGETVTVEANASEAEVVCGNVETSNARVHIIDTVLLPQSMG